MSENDTAQKIWYYVNSL